MVSRTIFEGLGEIGIRPALGRGAVPAAVSEAEVPFSHHSGPVSIATKKGGKCWAGFLDQGITLHAKENPVFE